MPANPDRWPSGDEQPSDHGDRDRCQDADDDEALWHGSVLPPLADRTSETIFAYPVGRTVEGKPQEGHSWVLAGRDQRQRHPHAAKDTDVASIRPGRPLQARRRSIDRVDRPCTLSPPGSRQSHRSDSEHPAAGEDDHSASIGSALGYRRALLSSCSKPFPLGHGHTQRSRPTASADRRAGLGLVPAKPG
jgi:hypothetical protein